MLPRMRVSPRQLVIEWLDAERDRLVLWLPVFMGMGVAGYYGLRFEPAVWIGPVAVVPLVAAAVVLPRLRLLLAPLAAIALGFASGQIATARAPPIEGGLPTHATVVTGTILSAEMLPAGRRITIQPATLDDAAIPLVRSVRIRLRAEDDETLDAGDSVRVRALIRPPAPPAYPGAWDLQRDDFYARLGASGYAIGVSERTGRAVPSGLMRRVQWLREVIAERVVAVIQGAAGGDCGHAADRVPRWQSRPRITPRSAIRGWRICWLWPGFTSASSWGSPCCWLGRALR